MKDRERRITLRRRDVFEDILLDPFGHQVTSTLYRVQDVNRDPEGGDYLYACAALDESEVPSSTTLSLKPGERKRRRARIPTTYVAYPGEVVHQITKTEAPEGTKWSYDL